MFSSLSNFLPSALHGSSTPQKADQIRDDDDDEDDPGSKSDTNEMGVIKKKKDKSANETFIFVRPPPAKSNHPLNLQVQLVPPNSRGPSGLTSASRQSLDLSASAPVTPANSAPTSPVDANPPNAGYESGAPLARTASNRSTASSTYSSTSTTSTSSTASSRRMIVPLYNLQAHNVMTNIIVDAGTDAKIARFTKRGIEMLDLAVLEPIEVYAGGGAPTNAGDAPPQGGTSGFSNRTLGGRPSFSDRLGVPLGGGGSSRPATPDPTNSSQASLASSSDAGQSQQSHHSRSLSHGTVVPSSALAPGTPQGTPQKRNVFGRLFKKKDGAPVSPAASLTPTPMGHGHTRTLSAVSATTPTPMATAGLAPPRTSMSSAHRSSIDLPAPAPAPEEVRAPVLGLQASVSSPMHPPRGRPGLYVWVVRRWLKGEGGGGLLAVARGMVKAQGGDDLAGEVEVRFEWKRGKGKARRRREKEGKEGRGEEGTEHDGGSKASRRQPSAANLSAGPTKRLSMSIISRQSSFSVASTEDGQVVGDPTAGAAARRRSIHVQQAEDSGDESDPEDSETPWTCTVKIRRLAAAHAHARARSHHAFGRSDERVESQEDEKTRRDQEKQWKKEVLRIKVGTLSPTPHHPKVVAMLKVPFPLPDVDVEHMVVRKREPGTTGSLNAGMMKPGHGLMLTAEEIKDVVCSTGLWLVVREGFGGIGKVSRKGDGWRIRG